MSAQLVLSILGVFTLIAAELHDDQVPVSFEDQFCEDHVPLAQLQTSFLQINFEQKHHQNSPVQQQGGGKRRITPANDDVYYWAGRGGDAAHSSHVPYTAPTNISLGPSWVWANELLEQVRHSPLIDNDSNIYVSTTHRIRKFSSDGDVLWTFEVAAEDGLLVDSPYLYEDTIFALASSGQTGSQLQPTALSINMKDGTLNWKRRFENFLVGLEASSLNVYNGTMFFGSFDSGESGVTKVVAASASDGSYLWEYKVTEVLWNFSPSTPGDGTLLFSSTCGAAFRISFNGQLMWKAGRSHPGEHCGTGGGAVGPNGVFYAEFSDHSGAGYISAHQIEDGTLLWEKQFALGGLQYPAVGHLGTEGPLAVVIALGDPLRPPQPPQVDALAIASRGPLRNSVFALDAMTGETIWYSDEEPWYHTYGAGELEEHEEGQPMCWPDPQGIPVIAGDGTVYASSSHGGALRAIRDANGNGVIEPSEVSVFETRHCFLNSPSVAPGMLVAAPCWGPMYVFKHEHL